MANIQFLVTNPYDENVIGCFGTIDEATSYARAVNRADPDHPSLRLFEVHENSRAYYVGNLLREFGHDFDPANCWQLR